MNCSKTRQAVVLAAGMSIWVAVGCDRSPSAPPPPPPPSANAPGGSAALLPGQAAANSRPTTQELLSAPMKKTLLPGMPLSLKTPPSWKLDQAGPIAFLAGPTPGGEVTIQLSGGDSVATFNQRQIDLIIERLKQDKQTETGAASSANAGGAREKVLLSDVRDLGNLKLIEKVARLPDSTTPNTDSLGNPIRDKDGNPTSITIKPVRWTLTVFVPFQDAFSRYELNLIDLTAEQYDVDKEFVARILRTLAYEGASEAPAATQPGGGGATQ